jgi:hypothetical protein
MHFKITRGEDVEGFQHDQMIIAGENANYTDFIIIDYIIHVSNYSIVSHK